MTHSPPQPAAERQQRLHATDVAAILGLSPHRVGYEVWLEKSGRIEPWGGNAATEIGSRLEAPILDVAESELGPLRRNVLRVADGLDFPLAATLDAELHPQVPVEAKTSGIVGPVYGEWGEDGTDVVPPAYLVQLTVQMLCSGSDLAHLYALLGGRGIVRYRVVRDEEVVRTISEFCGRWWQRHVVEAIEPERTEPVPLEVVKRIRRQPHKTIALDDSATQTIAEYELAKAKKNTWEKCLADAQANLLLLLGDAEAATLPDGRRLTYLEQARKGYTVSDYQFRVLRIKQERQ